MSENLSVPNVATSNVAPRRFLPVAFAGAVIGLLLAATVALWAHYGTALFFEMIRTGLATCFG